MHAPPGWSCQRTDTIPLPTATLVLQHEPGKVVVVWANIVIAGDPVIEHANTPNDERVLDVIDGVFSLHGLSAVPRNIASTIRRETVTTTRHRNTQNALVPEEIDGVFSLHQHNTVPGRIIRIIGRKTIHHQ